MSMEAYVTADAHRAEIKLINRPVPEKGEALIKVKSVTCNPTDWKHIAFISPPGVTTGCDFAGIVEEINGESSSIKKGDRVASFVHGGKYPDRGSFAEYVKTDSELCMKIPEGLSDEQAASVGIGGTTAVQALFHRLKLNKPNPSQGLPSLSADSPQVLIWSGSTAVGQYAIQLARAAGYHVITTASPKQHPLLKELGAAEVYDYKEEGLPEKISKEHPKLSKALDCISEGGTQSLVVRSLGSSGGEVVVLLAPEKEAKALREDVKIIHTLIYTMLGRPFGYGKASFSEEQVGADREAMLEFLSGEGLLYQLFQKKLIQGPKIKKVEGGLAGLDEALNYLKEGKVSGEKVAVTVSV